MIRFSGLIDEIAATAQPGMSRAASNFASSQGWPKDVARSLRVSNKSGSWTVSSDHPQAADLEYGDGVSRPTGVIRQLSNRPEVLEGPLLAAANRILKEVL